MLKLNEFDSHEFDWAQNITTIRLIRTSDVKGWELDANDLYINYTIVIGIEFSSSAPRIIGDDRLDDSNRYSSNTENIVYWLMSGFEAIYKCAWFEAYVFEIETIRLSKYHLCLFLLFKICNFKLFLKNYFQR